MESISLDSTDLRLLDALQRDASQTNQRLAADVGISPPTCLRRVQRLRDEAHRFASGAHRTRRSMDIKKNPLDEIEGVGPGRKKALLHAFGSAKGVGRAAVVDLEKVEGINRALAERIHGFFHPAGQRSPLARHDEGQAVVAPGCVVFCGEDVEAGGACKLTKLGLPEHADIGRLADRAHPRQQDGADERSGE
eukprot:gene39477-52038_t